MAKAWNYIEWLNKLFNYVHLYYQALWETNT